MSDDAKEWVTVKIEAPVRDDAQADPRTYSEIMRAGLDAPNPENDADINRDLLAEQVVDTLDAEAPGYYDVQDQLDRIESAAKEATNAAQNAERAAEELAGQR